MEHLYVIGIDYGTDSVRALLADAESGEEIAVAVCNSPAGAGVVLRYREVAVSPAPAGLSGGWSRCCAGHCAVSCAGGDTRHRRGYDRQHAVSGRSHLHAAVADGGL
ncbi:MAG: hypothetical protein ACLRM8_00270 [Alistipes sp.]